MKRIQNRSTYDATIDDLMYYRRKVDDMRPLLEIVDHVVREFSDTLNISGSCGWKPGSLEGALILVHNLDDIRSVIPVLKRLRELGFKCKRFDDYPEIHRRTYDCEGIKVLAFLSYNEGATCRYVEVGKEETPVYKLMCDDQSKGD